MTMGTPMLYHNLTSSRIPGLDVIRAAAVFLVIFYHAGFPVPGGYGVVAFFVLSGFLITWLLLKEHDETGNVSLTQFYRRRALRIFPAFYCYVVLVLALKFTKGDSIDWPSTASAAGYFANYYYPFASQPMPEFAHTWSLAIEEQFYLLWPLVFLFIPRHHLGRTLAVTIAVIWCLRQVYCQMGVSHRYQYGAFELRADALLIGCLAAVVVHRRVFTGALNAITSRAWQPLVTLSLLIGVIALEDSSRYRDSVGLVLAPPLLAVLLLQLVAQSSSQSWAWINQPWIAFLSKISYGLYLYQQLALYPLQVRTGSTALAVAGTVVLATVSYYVVEEPLLRLKHKRGKRAALSPAIPPPKRA